MTIIEERTYNSIVNIANSMRDLNKNLERIAAALEAQNKLAGALGLKADGESTEDGGKTDY